MEFKKYKVQFDNYFEMTIRIKSDTETTKILHQINDFWTDSKDRLSKENGSIESVVVKLIAKEVVLIQATSFSGSLDSVKEVFDNGIEGFYPVDGSFGIEIIDIDIDFEISELEFNVSRES